MQSFFDAKVFLTKGNVFRSSGALTFMVTCFLCTEALCDMLLYTCVISFPRLQKVVTHDRSPAPDLLVPHTGKRRVSPVLYEAPFSQLGLNGLESGRCQALLTMRLNSFSIPWRLDPPCVLGVSSLFQAPGWLKASVCSDK